MTGLIVLTDVKTLVMMQKLELITAGLKPSKIRHVDRVNVKYQKSTSSLPICKIEKSNARNQTVRD